MNLYNLFNIQNVLNFEMPTADQIEKQLNEIATPTFLKLGLKNNKYKYRWEGEYDSNEMKNIISFSYRGPTGNITRGKKFKFIPSITSNYELKRRGTESHLFEYIDYFNDKVGISLWNNYFFEKNTKEVY